MIGFSLSHCMIAQVQQQIPTDTVQALLAETGVVGLSYCYP
jgi:hypothetical protein